MIDKFGLPHIFRYFWGILRGSFYIRSLRNIPLVVHPLAHFNVDRGGRLEINGRLIFGYQRWGSRVKWSAHPGQLLVMTGGRLTVDGIVQIPPGVEIVVKPGASLKIKNGTFFSHSSTIVASDSVEIGTMCAISWGVSILDGDLHSVRDKKGKVTNSPRRIIIGNNVWIGHGVSVLKGSQIGSNSIVGAKTVVTKTFPDNAVISGVPAKQTHELKGSWDITGTGLLCEEGRRPDCGGSL